MSKFCLKCRASFLISFSFLLSSSFSFPFFFPLSSLPSSFLFYFFPFFPWWGFLWGPFFYVIPLFFLSFFSLSSLFSLLLLHVFPLPLCGAGGSFPFHKRFHFFSAGVAFFFFFPFDSTIFFIEAS